MDRPKNCAPLEMRGKYTIYVSENKVHIKDEIINKEAEVRCHPDDTFNIGEAIKIGLNRLNMDKVIRIGDTVKIVNNGDSYCAATDWNDVDKKYAIRYRFGVVPKNGTIGKVVGQLNFRYIIQVNEEKYLGAKEFENLSCFDSIYIMKEHGLEKIKDGRYE